jgi:transcription elongation factor SPT6
VFSSGLINFIFCRPRPKKTARKKATKKSIFEIYEPSELKRGHFTDLDNEVNVFSLADLFAHV